MTQIRAHYRRYTVSAIVGSVSCLVSFAAWWAVTNLILAGSVPADRVALVAIICMAGVWLTLTIGLLLQRSWFQRGASYGVPLILLVGMAVVGSLGDGLSGVAALGIFLLPPFAAWALIWILVDRWAILNR